MKWALVITEEPLKKVKKLAGKMEFELFIAF